MFKFFLVIVVLCLGCLGMLFTVKAFFTTAAVKSNKNNDQKKILTIGAIGVIFLFCAAIGIIYLYSLQPASERIIKENINKEGKEALPDISKNFITI